MLSFAPETRPLSLILGTIVGYDKWDLVPFLESLRQTSFDGQVVFFAADLTKAAQDYLKERNVEIRDLRPYLKGSMHLLQARWIAYRDFLAPRANTQGYVLATDVADVVFQKDPLEKPINELEFYLEDDRMQLGTCWINSNWISIAFGDGVLAEISGGKISCSGTVIGTTAGMAAYTELMSRLILDLNARAAQTFGVDQAVHNLIAQKGLLPRVTMHPNYGRVATLHHTDPAALRIDHSTIVTSNGTTCAIIHQYNRHSRISSYVGRRYVGLGPTLRRVLRRRIAAWGGRVRAVADHVASDPAAATRRLFVKVTRGGHN